jgi:bifunctional DNase/RNase
MKDSRGIAMQEMLIDSIRVSLMNYQRVVILKEKDADRYLPIWIGSPEADSIAIKLQDVSVARPLTHDLLSSIVSALGANIERVVVSELTNDTFYAHLSVKLPDGTFKEIDCRPSDAMAIAVRGGYTVLGSNGEEHWVASIHEAQSMIEDSNNDNSRGINACIPIFVQENVLEKAAISMGNAISGEDSGEFSPDLKNTMPLSKKITEEEIQKMSAFSDFLQDLPGLEDLGEKSDS